MHMSCVSMFSVKYQHSWISWLVSEKFSVDIIILKISFLWNYDYDDDILIKIIKLFQCII